MVFKGGEGEGGGVRVWSSVTFFEKRVLIDYFTLRQVAFFHSAIDIVVSNRTDVY